MKRATKRLIGLPMTAGVVGLLIWAFLEGRTEMAREAQREEAIKAPSRVSRTADGRTVLKLSAEDQARIAIKIEPLQAISHRPEAAAYGFLHDDPSRVLAVRAPLVGVVRTIENKPWPNVGERVTAGQAVGVVVPRFGPMDQVSLMARLSVARADVAEDEASLAAERASYENKKRLNIENKIVSDRTLEEVATKFKAAEARLKAAKETVETLQDSLQQASGPARPLALTAERSGEVVEVLAAVGEAVESGQALLKLQEFDTLIARVELPAGVRLDGGSPAASAQASSASDVPAWQSARVIVHGLEDRPLTGEWVGLAPAVNSKTLGQAFLFRVTAGDLRLRPGMALTAYLPQAAAEIPGVIVPRAGVIRFGGAAWVYTQTGPDTFERKQIEVSCPIEAGWFVQGLSADERVVVAGGQTLLSEELKSQFGVEAD